MNICNGDVYRTIERFQRQWHCVLIDIVESKEVASQRQRNK
jgi:hypothetical protein